MKPFDEKFGENVRGVFDNYKETVDEQAWKQMKNRLEARSGTPFFAISPFMMRTAAAVALLIVISGSFWLFFLNPERTERETAYKQHEDVTDIADAASDDAYIDRSTGFTDIKHKSEPGVQQSEEITPGRFETTETSIIAQTTTLIDESPVPGLQAGMQHPSGEIPGVFTKDVGPGLIAAGKLAVADTDSLIILENMERLSHQEKGRERISLMEVSAGSMKTWSPDEMAGGIGYAAGITGDWPVGERLSISGGGIIVYNQFSLGNTTGAVNYARDEGVASLPHFDAAERYQVLEQRTTTDFEFTAIDIPVNIRYMLGEMSKSSIYVSAGFSSFIYLQQSYSSQSEVVAEYTAVNSRGHRIAETGYAIVTSSGKFDAFKRIDMARFLNLSGGYVIRGRNHAMVIEPFIKYPLGNVTNLNLNVGMAGLSLKYRPDNR